MNENKKVNNTQGVEYNNNKKALKIDLPFQLVEKLENIFHDENSKTFGKIIFTVYLINQGKYNKTDKKYENYYELSKTHYKTYVSLNQRFAPIMDKLIENGIIMKLGGYTQGRNYQKFKMVNRFTFKKNSKDFKSFFFTDDEGAYIKKYKKDGYIVKYSEPKEQKIKPINAVGKKDNKDKKIMELQELVKLQSEQINQLYQQIAELTSQINLGKLNKEENKPARTKSEIASAVRSETTEYSIKLKAEAELKKQQLVNSVEEPKTFEKPCQINVDAVWGVDVDYSQRATAYDGEIDKYIATNFLDANHIYNNIKSSKIDNLPALPSVKEGQCRGLWIAIKYKLNNIKKTA